MKNHHEEFSTLAETIKERSRNKNIYYFASPGNWGDAVIRHGTLEFFKKYEISYKELTGIKKEWILPYIKGGVVLYGGSGGWCFNYSLGSRLVNRLRKRFEVMVLPSTYEMSFSIPNTTFFCRDHFESKSNMPEAVFCHDMAFALGRLSAPQGKGIGYFFRTDVESSNKIKIPENNNDLSLKGWHLSDIQPFLDEIAKYEIIHTDRLHIGIVSSLLGREVHLYPGSYFKTRAIYNSSIKDYFDNVYFHEEAAF